MQYWKPKDYEFSLCRVYLESEKLSLRSYEKNFCSFFRSFPRLCIEIPEQCLQLGRFLPHPCRVLTY